MAGRPENLLPGGGGIERTGGVMLRSASHPQCTAIAKATGVRCQGVAAWGTAFCYVHLPRDKRPAEAVARGAAKGAAWSAFREARRALGDVIPAEVQHSPLWAVIPGDKTATVRRRAEALRAWAAIPDDGGAQWRSLLAREGKP